MPAITQDSVKGMFDYRDSNLYWKVRKANQIKIGDLAGYLRKDGYRQIDINYTSYLAHRLIFLYHNGYMPKGIDHVDGDASNNDISNLREATQSQNMMNRKKNISMNGNSPSSEYKGVSWYKRSEKWMARIQINGKQKYLGCFDSEIGAAKAYDQAAIELFVKFAKLNF